MTLEQLRIFVAVAERQHFTRAAEALGLTQSAISAAIRQLEGRFGVELFHRVGRHVELSEAGHSFLIEARDVLGAAGRAERALDELSGLAHGHLSVMGSQTVATYWLPPRLLRYRQAFPGIDLQLRIGNTAEVAAAVLAGTAELGFVEGDIDHPSLATAPVDRDRLVMVVGASHGWAAEQALEAAEMARLPWVLREPGSGTRAATEALLASRRLTLADVRIALELPSNEAVRVAVEEGAGASVLSFLVVTTGLRAGLLKATGCALPSRHFLSVRHRERRLSRAAAAFLEKAAAPGPG